VTAFTRRVLVLLTLLFWQGGFTFYASVVVPIGTEFLGSAVEQGFITAQVTRYLNLAGLVAVPVLLWDALATRATWRQRAPRLALWVGLAVTLAVLLWLHPLMADRMDREALRIHERSGFRRLHRGYLWTSTVQWVFGLVFLAWGVADWRRADRGLSAVGQAFQPDRPPPESGWKA
jgi:hypothetical protein